MHRSRTAKETVLRDENDLADDNDLTEDESDIVDPAKYWPAVEAPAEYFFHILCAVHAVPWEGLSITDAVRDKRTQLLHTRLNREMLRQLRFQICRSSSPYFRNRRLELLTLQSSLMSSGFGGSRKAIDGFCQTRLNLAIKLAGAALSRAYCYRIWSSPYINVNDDKLTQDERVAKQEAKNNGKIEQKHSLKTLLDLNWVEIPAITKKVRIS
jgi:hypothetical protein